MRMSRIFPKISSFSKSIRSRCEAALLRSEKAHLVIQSWCLLFRIGLVMRFLASETLRRIVRNESVSRSERSQHLTYEALSHAMDLACVFYFKRVRCLQHSAAATILLRRYGWRAEMVTGAQILPSEFHAWVEIDGNVVNDKPYMHDIYQEL